MEALLNQVLQAESAEQLGASNYERSQERSDYRNGVRTRTLTTRIGKIEKDSPQSSSVTFFIFLVDTPCTTISIIVVIKACSLR